MGRERRRAAAIRLQLRLAGTAATPSLAKTVQAFDANGKPFPLTANNSYTEIGGDDGSISLQTMEFRFRPGIGVPAKLVVVGPKTVLVEIPFAMENVPLP